MEKAVLLVFIGTSPSMEEILQRGRQGLLVDDHDRAL
jgi:hypothetical protein